MENEIIDLVQSSDGTYAPENEVRKTKRGRKEKEFHEAFDDLLDGVIEGRKVVSQVFKAFGVRL